MSNQISTAYSQEYTTVVEALLQQKGSRLRHCVREKNFTGKAAKAVEQIGKVAAQKRTSRHADTPLIETPHDARWVYPNDYEWADLIDDQDKLRMIADPQGEYAQNGAYALGRGMDEEIIEAFFGTNQTGENGDTATTFALDNGGSVAAGGVGMTIPKLKDAKKQLLQKNVDVENDELFCAISAEQHDDLLSETQAVSLDYNTNRGGRPVLEDGLITRFMGFTFIHTELLTYNTGTTRSCPAWAKSGMCLGIWNDVTTRITERDDKSYSTQVYVKGTFGATRTEGEKVVEILCVE